MQVFHKVFNISTRGMVGYRKVEKDGLKWGNVGRYMKEKIEDTKWGYGMVLRIDFEVFGNKK